MQCPGHGTEGRGLRETSHGCWGGAWGLLSLPWPLSSGLHPQASGGVGSEAPWGLSYSSKVRQSIISRH